MHCFLFGSKCHTFVGGDISLEECVLDQWGALTAPPLLAYSRTFTDIKASFDFSRERKSLGEPCFILLVIIGRVAVLALLTPRS